MKHFLLLKHSLAAALAVAMAGKALCAPSPAERAERAERAPAEKWRAVVPRARRQLPADVRARLPLGAVTVHLGRLPIGPGGAPMLVHIWAARRVAEPGRNAALEASPVCVDVFAASAGGRFVRRASAVFLTDDLPGEISSLWLRPARKQGPVLVLVGPVYMATKYTLVVFPKGVSDENEHPAFVQDLYQGGVGGGKILQGFGVDSAGIMTVVTENSLYGKAQSKTVRRWNGYEFKAPAER